MCQDGIARIHSENLFIYSHNILQVRDVKKVNCEYFNNLKFVEVLKLSQLARGVMRRRFLSNVGDA